MGKREERFSLLFVLTNFLQASGLRSVRVNNLALCRAAVYVASDKLIFKARFQLFSISFDKQIGRFEKTTYSHSTIGLIIVKDDTCSTIELPVAIGVTTQLLLWRS